MIARAVGLVLIAAACGSSPARVRPPETDAELRAGCEARRGASCVRLGDRLAAAWNAREAARWYEVACDLDDGAGCRALGQLHARALVDGDYVPSRSKALYEKACRLDDAEGCLYLGDMLTDESVAIGYGLGYDAAEALRVYGRACEMDEPRACLAAGRLTRGQRGLPGTVRDFLARAAALFAARCDANPFDCVDLGEMFHLGEARGDAARAFERACEAGNEHGCAWRARLAAWRDDEAAVHHWEARAAEVLARRCRSGDRDACRSLSDRGDASAAAVGCEQGDARLCVELAKTAASRGDADAAAASFGRACELEDAYGCFEHGTALLDRGDLGGRSSLEKACRLAPATDDWMCIRLAEWLVEGASMPADPARAREILVARCELRGEGSPSCRKLGALPAVE